MIFYAAKSSIQVSQLSKQYHLHKKPSQTIAELFRFGKAKKIASNTESQLFWVLKNVSFEIKKGEVIGIIGKMAQEKAP